MKADAGKPRPSLIPADALGCIAELLTDAAREHGDNGWARLDNATQRYYDALWRHVLEYGQGVRRDAKSGYPVLAHIASNALFLLALELRATRR
jgi:hypothetical protein